MQTDGSWRKVAPCESPPPSVAHIPLSQRTIDFRIVTWPIRYLKIRLAAPRGLDCGLMIYPSRQNPGQDTYASSVGVMGTTIDSIRLVMTSVLSTSPWLRNPNVVKMPWNSEAETSTLSRANADGSASGVPLKIGIYWTDGVVTPQLPVLRGLRIIRDLIQDLKHKVTFFFIIDEGITGQIRLTCPCQIIDWEPPSQTTAKRIHVSSSTLFHE